MVNSLEFGGAEKVIVDLANATARRHQVGICCVRVLGDLVQQLDTGIRVHCLDVGEGNQLSLPLKLRKYFQEFSPDVVHLHNWGNFLEVGMAALLTPGLPLIQTVHGPYMEYGDDWKSKVKKRLRRILEKLISRRYSMIVGVASTVEAYIKGEMHLSTPVSTIHNGIAAQIVNSNRQEFAPATAVVIFITVARLAPIKNQALMLRAFGLLHNRVPESELWIIGDGPEAESLKALSAELGVSAAVTFVGYQEKVADWLNRADVFLLSSNYEGVSISVLEAMRAGLPVIASNVGGIPETVETEVTGLVFESGNAEQMAQAMERLALDQPLRKKMGAVGTQRLQANFSIEAMLQGYEDLYKSFS